MGVTDLSSGLHVPRAFGACPRCPPPFPCSCRGMVGFCHSALLPALLGLRRPCCALHFVCLLWGRLGIGLVWVWRFVAGSALCPLLGCSWAWRWLFLWGEGGGVGCLVPYLPAHTTLSVHPAVQVGIMAGQGVVSGRAGSDAMSTTIPRFVLPLPSLTASRCLLFSLMARALHRVFVWHGGPCWVARGPPPSFFFLFGSGRGGGVRSSGFSFPSFPPT